MNIDRPVFAVGSKARRAVRSTQEPFDDLMQVASLGLVKALDRFDPGRRWARVSPP